MLTVTAVTVNIIYDYNVSLIFTVSVSNTSSFLLISDLIGSRYEPSLTGKIEVFHLLLPSVTETFTAPHPRRSFPV